MRSYSREGAASPPPRVPMTGEGAVLSGDRMEVTRNVTQQDEHLGVIYLSAAYDIRSQVYAYLGILGLMMLLAMAVALALSAGLRRTITGPWRNWSPLRTAS